MQSNEFLQLADKLHVSPTLLLSLIIILALWSLYWKAIAMWIAARKGERIWFAIFLLVNMAGILEILYIYKLSRRGDATLQQPF